MTSLENTLSAIDSEITTTAKLNRNKNNNNNNIDKDNKDVVPYNDTDSTANKSSSLEEDDQLTKKTAVLQSMTSDLTLSERSGAGSPTPSSSSDDPAEQQQQQQQRPVVIVSGGPLFCEEQEGEEEDDDEKKTEDASSLSKAEETASLVSTPVAVSGNHATTSLLSTSIDRYRVKTWCGTKFYSDLVKEGLDWLQQKTNTSTATTAPDAANVLMVYESPANETQGTSFVNKDKYFFHDPADLPYPRTVLGPLRYATMSGNAIPVYLKDEAPVGIIEHWTKTIPNFVTPTFVRQVQDTDHIYAYLPLEQVQNHVHDPQVHYHLAGKDAIPLMTNKTTKLLPDTQTVRPCVAKVNCSMGSRGIFIIRNDEDEQELRDFLKETGNPAYIVTEFVEIRRNIACHFFIHPNGEIIWLGSSENVGLPDGTWSGDSTMDLTKADELQALQMAQARDVADYCLSLGFWGFCGIDVLIDSNGNGHVVDVNPRVTGTCPAIMAAKSMKETFPHFDYGLFRRSSSHAYPGSEAELLAEVEAHNANNQGKSRVVIFSMKELGPQQTLLNIGVYGASLEECEKHLNHFSRVFKQNRVTYM